MARSSLNHPAPERRTLLQGRAAAYVQALIRTGAQRQSHAEAYFGVARFQELQAEQVLKIVYGTLGALVLPTRLAYQRLGISGRPVSALTATEQVALKEAVTLALTRGYTVVSVGARVVRLQDAQARQHVMQVRVAAGVTPPHTVASLIRQYSPSLRAGKGRLILVTLHPERYVTQAKRQPLLEVWTLTNTARS